MYLTMDLMTADSAKILLLSQAMAVAKADSSDADDGAFQGRTRVGPIAVPWPPFALGGAPLHGNMPKQNPLAMLRCRSFKCRIPNAKAGISLRILLFQSSTMVQEQGS